jgi:hypothetical protein
MENFADRQERKFNFSCCDERGGLCATGCYLYCPALDSQAGEKIVHQINAARASTNDD